MYILIHPMYMYDLQWFVPFMVLAQLVVLGLVYQSLRSQGNKIDGILSYFRVTTIVLVALLFLFVAKLGDDMIEYRINQKQTALYQEQNAFFDVYTCAVKHAMDTTNIYEQGESVFSAEQITDCRNGQKERDQLSNELEHKKSFLKWTYQIGLLSLLTLVHAMGWSIRSRSSSKKKR